MNFRPADWFQIDWTEGTVAGCQHENFEATFGKPVAGVRKRTVVCKDCGRREVQRPYKR
jgi:hypothetical protein